MGDRFLAVPRWDLLRLDRYLTATVSTARGCPERCSFCSVWRTDGREVRMRTVADTVSEVNDLRDRGFRHIVLADARTRSRAPRQARWWGQ